MMVIGVGNEFRRDDGAGLAVVARLRDRVPPGGGTGAHRRRAHPADRGLDQGGARRRGRRRPRPSAPPRPGAPVRAGSALAGETRTASSHGFGLDDAIRLALALDRMPRRLIVHAIEAADLSQGTGLTPLVAAAMDEVASAVLTDISHLR